MKQLKLSRKRSNRQALFKNLATSFFEYGQITTTEAKARALKPIVEKLLAKAKKEDLNAKRAIAAYLNNPKVTKKVFDEIVPNLERKHSSHVKTIKITHRQGDGANQTVLHLSYNSNTEPNKSKSNKTPANKGKQ